MNNKKIISVIAIIMAVLMLMTLIVSVIPVSAFAEVTQADIDEAQRKKDELVAQRQASQEKIDKLKEQQAKRAAATPPPLFPARTTGYNKNKKHK